MTDSDTIAMLQQGLQLISPLLIAGAIRLGFKALAAYELRTGDQLTAQQVQAVHDAAETAAGIGMSLLSRGVLHLSDVHVGNTTLLRVAGESLSRVADAADATGVKLPDMAQMVVGRLGKMITADPTISTLPPVPQAVPQPAPTAAPQPTTQETPVAPPA